jgi:ABC-2 type transport system permease protein
MAIVLIAPLLILSLLYLLLGDSSYVPTIAVDESKLPPVIISALKEQDANLINISTDNLNIKQYLIDNKNIDAVLTSSNSGLSITMYESSSKSGKAVSAIQAAIASLNPSGQLQISFVVGNPEYPLFDSFGYIFFGVISFFLTFIISGMALVRERSSGTLERMLMTPVTRVSVVGGYTLGFSVFAVVQSVLLVLFSIYVLGLHNEGNIIWIILTMFLLAIAAVSFGELISIFSNTEFQVVQLIPVAIIPQVFFSGLIPLDTIPYNLGYLCYIMPIYYGCAAIKEVMLLGNGFETIYPFLLALAAYILVLGLLNTLALKKYRKL